VPLPGRVSFIPHNSNVLLAMVTLAVTHRYHTVKQSRTPHGPNGLLIIHDLPKQEQAEVLLTRRSCGRG
jgi:hypothetical protein